jgi:hypothetical protein
MTATSTKRRWDAGRRGDHEISAAHANKRKSCAAWCVLAPETRGEMTARSAQIVLSSGGTLDARSSDGTTTFVMRLPRDAPSASPPSWQAESRA